MNKTAECPYQPYRIRYVRYGAFLLPSPTLIPPNLPESLRAASGGVFERCHPQNPEEPETPLTTAAVARPDRPILLPV
jgi:hypothetical protein